MSDKTEKATDIEPVTNDIDKELEETQKEEDTLEEGSQAEEEKEEAKTEDPEEVKKEKEPDESKEKKETEEKEEDKQEEEEQEEETEEEAEEEKNEDEVEEKNESGEETPPRYDYVSLKKHQKLKEKFRTATEELKQLKETKAETDDTVTTGDVKDILEKYNLDDTNKAFIEDLIGTLKKQIGVPKETLDSIQKAQADAESIKKKEFEDNQFSVDYNETFYELDDKGKVKKDADGKPVTKDGFDKAPELLEKVKELAFTKQFVNAPLDAVYLWAERTMPKVKKTSESTSTSHGEREDNLTKTFDQVTDEDVAKMDLETYEKYNEWQLKQELEQGTDISRGGKAMKV
jgi:hypothetical protein|tara:strand:- start:3188 stop:4225 length:1038 start_codon:yes stop_codon:yes gene_type:complete